MVKNRWPFEIRATSMYISVKIQFPLCNFFILENINCCSICGLFFNGGGGGGG